MRPELSARDAAIREILLLLKLDDDDSPIEDDHYAITLNGVRNLVRDYALVQRERDGQRARADLAEANYKTAVYDLKKLNAHVDGMREALSLLGGCRR